MVVKRIPACRGMLPLRPCSWRLSSPCSGIASRCPMRGSTEKPAFLPRLLRRPRRRRPVFLLRLLLRLRRRQRQRSLRPKRRETRRAEGCPSEERTRCAERHRHQCPPTSRAHPRLSLRLRRRPRRLRRKRLRRRERWRSNPQLRRGPSRAVRSGARSNPKNFSEAEMRQVRRPPRPWRQPRRLRPASQPIAALRQRCQPPSAVPAATARLRATCAKRPPSARRHPRRPRPVPMAHRAFRRWTSGLR